jgi:hypothetical protein
MISSRLAALLQATIQERRTPPPRVVVVPVLTAEEDVDHQALVTGLFDQFGIEVC